MNPRILFVGMTDSVHAARWMRQVADQGWDLRMFPVYAARPSPELRDLTVYGLSLFSPGGMDKSVRYRGLLPMGRGGGRAEKLIFRACPQLWEFSLARLIELIRPDIVHSLEFQHAAYLTLAARARVSRGFPTWIVSNWGSDIYLYGRLEEHRTKIKQVLSGCDYYCCECQRDVRLARDMGLRGKALPPLPNAGGFDLSRVSLLRQAGKVSSRRLILLKGYQGWAGRALMGLRALGLCRDSLKGYQIAVYSATPDVQDCGGALRAGYRYSGEDRPSVSARGDARLVWSSQDIPWSQHLRCDQHIPAGGHGHGGISNPVLHLLRR